MPEQAFLTINRGNAASAMAPGGGVTMDKVGLRAALSATDGGATSTAYRRHTHVRVMA